MLNFINNRERYKQNSDYMLKMKELKSFIDQQINTAVSQLRQFERDGGEKDDPKKIYEKVIQETVHF